MDGFRQNRSKICSADQSSGGRCFHEGNRRVQNQRNYRTFTSESSSSSSGITDEDSLMFDLGWRSSNQAAPAPMKKLLAKEMTQDTEYRRRSQGVIARLMGLDTLPPQPPLKQQKIRAEENRSETKVEKSPRSSPFSSHRFSRKSSREEQEFKDVFEVMETPKSRKNGHRPAVTGRSNITEDEMEFIRQKFIDAKRLSTDDKLHNSKEFRDTIEALDSNRDLLLKFLQQPDSQFRNHLHDLHGAPLQSQYDRRISAQSSFTQSKTPGRDGIGRSCGKSFQKHRISSHLKPTISPDKVESDIVPTRIVVLKPNLGKTKNSGSCVSSSTSHALSDSTTFSDFPISSHKDNEPSRSRKITRKVTREIKSAPNRRGCSADESSSSGKDSADEESDITILTSRKSLYSFHHRKPSCSSGESLVTREAEAVRRLSRRWRMANKSQEIGETSRGSTLADMLTLTDRDLRHQNMEDAQRVRQKLSSSVVKEPLGISSRDGWKDVFVQGLSRSRSVPNSSDFLSSPKPSLRIESPRNCRYTVPTEVMKWEKNKKIVRGKVKSRKAAGYYFTRGESSNASPETHSDSNFPTSPVVSEAPTAASNVIEKLADLENDNDESPSSPETEKQSDLLPLKECPDAARSKDAEQPSPVSTLEAPFTDDVSSSSECFESLCADLHGLRMQLQLLKLESESYTGEEESLSVLSDEDAAPGPTRSSSPSNPSRLTEETWESSYITEVFIGSGYDKPDPTTFMTKLHSLDDPINPSLFEHLEKMYQINSWPGRPERKLLFDRINSGFVDIHQQLLDPHPWVVCSGFRSQENVVALVDGLRKSLQNQERKFGKVRMESDVSSESKWLSLGGEIDSIGREIERLVMDEMVAEVIAMQ